MGKLAVWAATLLAAAVAATPAMAVEYVIEGGLLVRANNVMVNGQRYSVTFLDGTCISLFGGCNASGVTMDVGTALAAANALDQQVFLDGPFGAFDSRPELTRGCTSFECVIYIPYASGTRFASFENFSPEAGDLGFFDRVFTNLTFPADRDTNSPGWQFVTFARFESTVPEPGSWAMLIAGFGLTGAAMRRRRAAIA